MFSTLFWDEATSQNGRGVLDKAVGAGVHAVNMIMFGVCVADTTTEDTGMVRALDLHRGKEDLSQKRGIGRIDVLLMENMAIISRMGRPRGEESTWTCGGPWDESFKKQTKVCHSQKSGGLTSHRGSFGN